MRDLSLDVWDSTPGRGRMRMERDENESSELKFLFRGLAQTDLGTLFNDKT